MVSIAMVSMTFRSRVAAKRFKVHGALVMHAWFRGFPANRGKKQPQGRRKNQVGDMDNSALFRAKPHAAKDAARLLTADGGG